MEKVLSIIVPTYNSEKFLNKCLDSFIIKDEEVFNKLEVIVVNDGSMDKSADIAMEYVMKYPEVFYVINKENGGHGSGINVGARNANGKYFKVIDADDWVDTNGLVKLIEIMEKCDCDAVITDYNTYDIVTGKMMLYRAILGEGYEYYDLADTMKNWLSTEWGMTFHGIAYNTSFYQRQEYMLEENIFYEDQEYATVPMVRAEKICYTGLCVYIYRIGDMNQSVAADNQVKRLSHQEQIIKKCNEQYCWVSKLSDGQQAFWKKKTTMAVTSYYKIALLKNKNKKNGRSLTRHLNKYLKTNGKIIYEAVINKYICFLIMSYLHISFEWYEKYAPKIIKFKRKVLQKSSVF